MGLQDELFVTVTVNVPTLPTLPLLHSMAHASKGLAIENAED